MLGCGGRREILLVCLQMKNSSHVKISEDCRYAKVSLASFGQVNGLRASGKKLNFSDSPKIDCA